MRRTFSILCALMLAGTAAFAAQPDATELLQRVCARYASATTYRDTGVVRRTDRADQPFSTLYDRGRLRFEYTSTFPSRDLYHQMLIGDAHGAVIVTWFNQDAPRAPENVATLDQAVATLSGVSSGAAHWIPVLLMPQLGGWSWSRLQNPVLLEDGVIEGHPCYVLEGGHVRGDRERLWIDKASLLVRRHEWLGELAGVTDYRPEMDRPVAADEFR